MPTYAFRCSACGHERDFDTREPIDGHEVVSSQRSMAPEPGVVETERCPGVWKRIWSFGIAWPSDQRGH